MNTLVPFRTLVGAYGPSWLRRRELFVVFWAILVIVDVLLDMARQAVRRTLPGAVGCLPDGILAMGAEMGLHIGPNEEIEAFALRLSNVHDAIKRKGQTLELLRQIRAFFQAWGVFPIEHVDAFGLRIRLDVDGTITRDTVAADLEALRDGLLSRSRLYLYSGGKPPVTENVVGELVRDWTAGHVRLTGSVVWPGARVWNQPGLAWNSEGEKWNSEAPIVVEVS